MRKILALATLFLLAGNAAHACGACMDQMVVFNLPSAGPIFLIYLGWLLCALITRGIYWPQELEPYGLFPSRQGLIQAAVKTLGVYALLWFLTAFSYLFPTLLISAVWLLSIIIRTTAFGFRTLPPELARFRKFKAAFISVQLLFLLAVAASAAFATAYARKAPALVSMLSADNPGVRGQVVRELITKDQSAAEPLIAACRQDLLNSSGPNPVGHLSAALYCLGSIGGEKASTFLAAEFKTRVNFQKSDDAPWQRALCFAYVQSAGMKAVGDLRDLYAKCDQGDAAAERWAILVALLKTGSKPGVTFVLDHADVLANADEKTARAAFTALLTGTDPQALKVLPVSPAIDMWAQNVDSQKLGKYMTLYAQAVGGYDWNAQLPEARWRWLGTKP